MSAYIIAEIGSNHCNDDGLLLELINAAAFAGCDAVKLQLFHVDRLWKTQEEADKRRKYETRPELISVAAAEAERLGLDFLCTPFDSAAVEFLRPYVNQWKIASPHIGDRELQDAICEDTKPIILSTGIIAPESVHRYCSEWRFHGKDVRAVTPLVCVSAYPANASDYALRSWLARAGLTTGDRVGAWRPWGISDHTMGVGVAIAAVCLGATVVEKHIALKEQPPAPDDGPHALRPQALRAMVSGIKQAEAAIIGRRKPSPISPARKVWR